MSETHQAIRSARRAARGAGSASMRDATCAAGPEAGEGLRLPGCLLAEAVRASATGARRQIDPPRTAALERFVPIIPTVQRGEFAMKAAMIRTAILVVCSLAVLCLCGCNTVAPGMKHRMENYVLDFATPVDAELQAKVEEADARLRQRFGMTPEQTAVGLLDLRRLRLAMIHPDRIEYAASVPKIGILLAWFELHPEAARTLDAQTRHELGLMIKESSNEMATKFSRQMGLARIQEVLNTYRFYDTNHGGGIWMGKHYGKGDERIGDPIGNHSHAATVRQLLRFYLSLEQGKLVSVEASKTMREVFQSSDIPHDQVKFVKALAGRDVQLLRKWGTWENWRHDTAIVSGPGRHYIVVALTKHPKGDEYLFEFAKDVDDLMMR